MHGHPAISPSWVTTSPSTRDQATARRAQEDARYSGDRRHSLIGEEIGNPDAVTGP